MKKVIFWTIYMIVFSMIFLISKKIGGVAGDAFNNGLLIFVTLRAADYYNKIFENNNTTENEHAKK
jgi:hypothetical protein